MIEKIKEALKISSVPAIIASLCCLSPVILVLTGLATTTFAASLSDLFYGTYKWVFRGVGFVALVIAYIFYIRRQGVCTFDEAIKRRNELINKFMLVLIVAILFYVIFLYGFVEYLGIKLGIWE
jgi:bacteriorhodopsin